MTHLSHPDRHMLIIISDEAGVQFIVKLLEDDWTTFRPKWKWLCQHFDRYPSHSRCSKTHYWWPNNWRWSIRGIQVRPACRQKTKGPVPWRRRGCCSMSLSDIRNKTSASNWNNVTLQAGKNIIICSRGPGGREPPSPDERCPFPHTRPIPLGARQRRRDIGKDEQSCSGQADAGLTSRNDPWAFCYHNWWHESGSEDEGQWPDILSTCRPSTDAHPTCRSQESQFRCGLRYVSRTLDQERRDIEQEYFSNQGAMWPDPAVEKVS